MKLQDASFLVTGGAGFIGSNLSRFLIQSGAKKVRVLDNLSTGFLSNIEDLISYESFEFMEGDICNPDDCSRAMDGINYVSHQAALGSVPRSLKDPIASAQNNIMGFLNVLLAARDANVQKVVYAGSSSTYGDSTYLPKKEDTIGKPLSPYAVTKYADELFAEVFANAYEMNIIGMRYFNVFGPYQNIMGPYAAVIPLMITNILDKKGPTIFGDGKQSRDFTFIENVIQANLKAMLAEPFANRHEVFNIAFGSTTSVNDLWATVCELNGEWIDAIHGPERKGDIRDSLADVSKASTMLDYRPVVSVKDGLAKTFEWYKKNHNKA